MAVGHVFLAAKPIAVLVSIMMLSTLDASVLKITEELRSEEVSPITPKGRSVNTKSPDEIFFEESVKILNQLVQNGSVADEQILANEQMLGDQPVPGQSHGSSFNATRNGKDIENEERRRAYFEWQKENWLKEIQLRLAVTLDRGELLTSGNESLPTVSSQPMLPILSPATLMSTYLREAIPPLCPITITNDGYLKVSFNISEPRASTKETILHVISAELKLYKIPLKIKGGSDEVVENQWGEVLDKARIPSLDKVIATKVDEQRMITINVFKVRNKSKNSTLKILDTRMVPASLSGITTWNVTKAINVWGNDTKRTLNLMITVEDENRNKIPAQSVFEMRCGNNFYKPFPVDLPYKPSNRTHTAWINLATVERAVDTEAFNGIASTANRIRSGMHRAGGSTQRVALTLDESPDD